MARIGKCPLIIIMILVLTMLGCVKKEKEFRQELKSDKQVSKELQAEEMKDGRKLDLNTNSNNSSLARTYSANSQQAIIYTKLNTWNNDRDYYEIAFKAQFNDDITSENLAKYIQFSPKVKGTYEIVEGEIVRFYPVDRFQGEKKYSLEINQAALFSTEMPKVELSFYNSVPILQLGQVSLHPTDIEDEYYFEIVINHYRGRYSDSDYKAGLKLLVANKKIAIELINYDQSGTMTLKSARFKASEKDKIVLSTEKKVLNQTKNRSIYYANTIAEMRKFLIRQVTTVTDKQGNARIELNFSKELDRRQSLAGFILIDGEDVKAENISKFQSKAIITGDFLLGKEYEVRINAGVKAIDNSEIKETYSKRIKTYNRDRLLEFADNGIFISEQNNNSLDVKVINYLNFSYELWTIQLENVAEMIHNLDITNYAYNNQDYYRRENLHWYGTLLKQETIETQVDIDKESIIRLDLKDLVQSNPKKIYILNLTGKTKDNDNINTASSNRFYYNTSNRSSKLFIFTDYAITAKAFNNSVAINIIDVINNSPVNRAEVELRSFNNSLLASGKTDHNGSLILTNLEKTLDNGEFFIIAKEREHIAFLSSSSMVLDDSKFQLVKDYNKKDFKVEAFMDRSIYRPGEKVNLIAIVRDKNNNPLEESIPLIVNLYDPQNNKYKSERISEYKDGFASYNFQTDKNINTGNWRFEVEFGSIVEYVNFNIESFVPERLNTTLSSDKDEYLSIDEKANISLSSQYLFGAPVENAKCEISYSYNLNYSFGKDKFTDYDFIDDFSMPDYSLYNNSVELFSNKEGLTDLTIDLLRDKQIKNPYLLNIVAQITEEDSCPIHREITLSVSPLKKYIGLGSNRYLKAKSDLYQIPVIVLNEMGKELDSSQIIEYTVYAKQGSWWWDYDYNYQTSFKNSESSTVLKKGELNLKNEKYISFESKSSDYYLFIVEARIKGEGKTEISRKYYNSYWGENTEITEDSYLELKTDKDEYVTGEKIRVSIPATQGSKIFINIVKQEVILKQEIINVKRNGDYFYEFVADSNMTPNVYLDVRLVQGFDNKSNDLPLRLFGIIPIRIVNEDTRLDIHLDTPTKINSNSILKANIDIGVKDKVQYIVSIVDQGLVNKSNYVIPNPWNLFYKNEAYYARDFDNYSYFINSQNQDIFRTVMIGGGMFEASMAKMDEAAIGAFREMNRLQETGVDRFQPKTFFLGILETDRNGKGEFEVKIDDYIGALRVSIIAVKGNSFGSCVNNVIVKDDIIAMPTLPRVLSPSDEIQIPVKVIIDEIIDASVEVEIQTNEIVQITSNSSIIIPKGITSELLIFNAKVKDDIGKAEFLFNIKSKNFSNQKKINVGVRLPSSYETTSKILSFDNEGQIVLHVPNSGYSNSNKVTLALSQGFDFDADQLQEQILRYPYGGAIMKTALTFNQVLLSSFLKDPNLANQLDANINSYFAEIVKYNRNGLYEWEGWWKETKSQRILNIYALHTAILAREKGYNINDFVYNEILQYLIRHSVNSDEVSFQDAYQLYVLALAGKPDVAKLNYYSEKKELKIDSKALTMLKLAYLESGFLLENVTFLDSGKIIVKLTSNDNCLYPTEDVNAALDLAYAAKYNNDNEVLKAQNRASAISIANKITKTNYWNYYVKSWNLLALNQYIKTLPKNYNRYKATELEIIHQGKKETLNLTDYLAIDLTNYKEQDVTINASIEEMENITPTLYNTYVPKFSETEYYSNNMELVITYSDEEGNLLDPTSLKSSTSFVAHFKVLAEQSNNDFALTYILPAGWEFADNVRNQNLLQDSYGGINEAHYVDIRDDRAIIYGKTITNNYFTHELKINAVTKGKFNMPASIVEDLYLPEIKAVEKGRIVEVE